MMIRLINRVFEQLIKCEQMLKFSQKFPVKQDKEDFLIQNLLSYVKVLNLR